MTMTPIIKTLFPQFPYPQDASRRILQRAFARLRYQVEGLENIPRQGPVLLIMNHTGWEEVLLTILTAPRPLKFAGIREELHLDEDEAWQRLFETVHLSDSSPHTRTVLRFLGRQLGEAIRLQLLAFGFIPTEVRNQTRGFRLAGHGIGAMLRCLADGEILVTYPEGGFHRQGRMLPFRYGLGLLLRHAERRNIPVQVVPAAQHSAGAISWSLGTAYTPRIVFGAPLRISAAGRSVAEFDTWVSRHLQDHVHALMRRAWVGYSIPEQTYARSFGEPAARPDAAPEIAPEIDALVLQGGANRSLFTLGFLRAAGPALTGVRQIAATSSAAAVACIHLLGLHEEALEHLLRSLRNARAGSPLLRLLRGQRPMPHYDAYRQLLTTFVNDAGFAAIRDHAIRLRILIGISPGRSWLRAAKMVRDAYRYERPPARIEQQVIEAHSCRSAAELQQAVLASAAVPIVSPLPRLAGGRAVDGSSICTVPLCALDGGSHPLVVLNQPQSEKTLDSFVSRIAPADEPTLPRWNFSDERGFRELYEQGLAVGARFAAAQRNGASRPAKLDILGATLPRE